MNWKISEPWVIWIYHSSSMTPLAWYKCFLSLSKLTSQQKSWKSSDTTILSKTGIGWTIHGKVGSSDKKTEKNWGIFHMLWRSRWETWVGEELHDRGKFWNSNHKNSQEKDQGGRKSNIDSRKFDSAIWKSIWSKIPMKRKWICFSWLMTNQKLKCFEKRLFLDKKLAMSYQNEIQKLLQKKDDPVTVKQIKNANTTGVWESSSCLWCSWKSKWLITELLPGPDWLTSLFRKPSDV